MCQYHLRLAWRPRHRRRRWRRWRRWRLSHFFIFCAFECFHHHKIIKSVNILPCFVHQWTGGKCERLNDKTRRSDGRLRGMRMSRSHFHSNEIHINVHFMLNQWTYQHMANVKHLLLIIVCVSHPHIYEIVLTCSATKVIMWQKFNIIIPIFFSCAHSFVRSFVVRCQFLFSSIHFIFNPTLCSIVKSMNKKKQHEFVCHKYSRDDFRKFA